jgi:hypothetical protein
VERAASVGRLRGENEALRMSLLDLERDSELVGSGRSMRQVRAQIERVAKSQATVLIQGESGTGKELVARAIHTASSRAGNAMLCLNCAALSASLLESELFGHERGAFTGADKTRKGRFELASGGTLLLDEISEVSLPVQSKLLRVLQEREFERVGSSQTIQADVRVIVTTNRDLSDWVARRRFREDLFFRVSVLPVTLPPLRDRREDIPELAAHFLNRISRREGSTAKAITPSAMNVLENYHCQPDRAMVGQLGKGRGQQQTDAAGSHDGRYGAIPDRNDACAFQWSSREDGQGPGNRRTHAGHEAQAVARGSRSPDDPADSTENCRIRAQTLRGPGAGTAPAAALVSIRMKYLRRRARLHCWHVAC